MCAVNPIRLSLSLHWDEMLQMLMKLSLCEQNMNKKCFLKMLDFLLNWNTLGISIYFGFLCHKALGIILKLHFSSSDSPKHVRMEFFNSDYKMIDLFSTYRPTDDGNLRSQDRLTRFRVTKLLRETCEEGNNQ